MPSALSQHVLPTDGASQGWSSAGGLPFILAMLKRCTLFAFLPCRHRFSPAAHFARLGGLRSPSGERAASILSAFLLAFMAIGRPDNFYWGILLAPLLPIGLAFAPAALGSGRRRREAPHRGAACHCINN
jgi:hypothetical protein